MITWNDLEFKNESRRWKKKEQKMAAILKWKGKDTKRVRLAGSWISTFPFSPWREGFDSVSHLTYFFSSNCVTIIFYGPGKRDGFLKG